MISPTGYPMRVLKGSPTIGAGNRPNCEAYGYLLDGKGSCAYITAYNREAAAHPEARKVSVMDKTCLCTAMRNFDCWTCGHNAYRLKETSRQLEDGEKCTPTLFLPSMLIKRSIQSQHLAFQP